jgi:bromodomain-containing protein 7/9
MPLAEYVENYIVDPLTDGFHNVLRTTAQHLIDPSSTPPLPTTIASQVDSAVHSYPSVSHTLTKLKQVTSEAIDMAALIHFPAELFLSESEWAGARWKEEKVEKAEGDDAQAMASDESDGQGASEYLAFAIKSHQEAQAKATGNSTTGFAQDEPGVLQYVLDYVADAIAELEARRQDGTWQVKVESEDKESGEDARLRELRLNLLALAKRAPLDKIQRLPAELVPEHIRHFVPTVAAPLSL